MTGEPVAFQFSIETTPVTRKKRPVEVASWTQFGLTFLFGPKLVSRFYRSADVVVGQRRRRATLRLDSLYFLVTKLSIGKPVDPVSVVGRPGAEAFVVRQQLLAAKPGIAKRPSRNPESLVGFGLGWFGKVLGQENTHH